jgi:hypothetical protein
MCVTYKPTAFYNKMHSYKAIITALKASVQPALASRTSDVIINAANGVAPFSI